MTRYHRHEAKHTEKWHETGPTATASPTKLRHTSKESNVMASGAGGGTGRGGQRESRQRREKSKMKGKKCLFLCHYDDGILRRMERGGGGGGVGGRALTADTTCDRGTWPSIDGRPPRRPRLRWPNAASSLRGGRASRRARWAPGACASPRRPRPSPGCSGRPDWRPSRGSRAPHCGPPCPSPIRRLERRKENERLRLKWPSASFFFNFIFNGSPARRVRRGGGQQTRIGFLCP